MKRRGTRPSLKESVNAAARAAPRTMVELVRPEGSLAIELLRPGRPREGAAARAEGARGRRAVGGKHDWDHEVPIVGRVHQGLDRY